MRKVLENLGLKLKGNWAQVRRTWNCPERGKNAEGKVG